MVYEISLLQRVESISSLINSMKASVVWISSDQTYCFTQVFNPGASILDKVAYSLEQIRDRVSEIVGIQRDLASLLARKDAHRRADALQTVRLL